MDGSHKDWQGCPPRPPARSLRDWGCGQLAKLNVRQHISDGSSAPNPFETDGCRLPPTLLKPTGVCPNPFETHGCRLPPTPLEPTGVVCPQPLWNQLVVSLRMCAFKALPRALAAHVCVQRVQCHRLPAGVRLAAHVCVQNVASRSRCACVRSTRSIPEGNFNRTRTRDLCS